VKAFFTSDWHLDAITDGVPRFEELQQLVTRTVDEAIEEKADLYVFTGDLCDPDGWNVVRAQCFIIEQAARCYEAGIKFLAVAGNHDVVDDGLGSTTLSTLAASQYAFHVFEQPGEIVIPNAGKGPDLHVVGFPFTATSHRYDPVVEMRRLSKTRQNEVTLVLEHLNVTGIGSGSESKDFARGREVVFPLDEVKRKWPSATLVGGHYHRAQEFNGLNIVGSLARLRHDEEDHNPSVLVMNL
jgi:DNA repair exonuclease SbcCD nuclease subunit